MSCASLRSALQDVALGRSVNPRLEAHLISCGSCRRQVEEDGRLAGRMDAEIEQMLAIEVSPDLVARLRARVAGTETTSNRAVRWWVPVALAASVLVLVVLLAGRTPRSSPPLAPAPDTARVVSQTPGEGVAASIPVAPPLALERSSSERRVAAITASPAAPRRVAPEVLIPPGEREAVRRFVEGRHRWRVWGETSAAVIQLSAEAVAPELETLETPAVVNWELETHEAQGVVVRVLDSWPLMPGH